VRWARRYVSTLWRLVTLELWYRLMVDPARPQPPWPAAAPAMGTREARAEATPLPPGFIAG
jgi:hypothetical protein